MGSRLAQFTALGAIARSAPEPRHSIPIDPALLTAGRPAEAASFFTGVPSRRQREDEDPNSEDAQRYKRTKTMIYMIAQENEINVEQLLEFSELSLDERLLILVGSTWGLKQLLQKRTAATLFSTSAFRTSFRCRAAALLLSPLCMSYVSDILDPTRDMIKERPDIFDVPPFVYNHPELLMLLGQKTSLAFSTARSAMRQKIVESIPERWQISVLAHKITAMFGLEFTTAHLCRLAVLRRLTVMFDGAKKKGVSADHIPSVPTPAAFASSASASSAIPGASDAAMPLPVFADTGEDTVINDDVLKNVRWSATAFWSYTDSFLADVRSQMRASSADAVAYDEAMSEFFNNALQDDMREYYVHDKKRIYRPQQNITLPWQITVEGFLPGRWDDVPI